MKLTPTQQAVYDWILSYARERGRVPTYHAIREAFGWGCVNTVTLNLRKLQLKGLVRMSREHRGLELVGYRFQLVEDAA